MNIENIFRKIEPCINSYLNPLDLVDIINLMDTGEDIFKEKRLSLKISDSSLIPILKRIGYLDFIKQIIEHLNYDADLLPIFTSQVEESMVSLFDKMVRAYKKNVTVFFDESLPAVIIQAPIGINCIIYSIMAEIHNKTINAIEVCLQFKGIGTFPNPKNASPLENFIEEWSYEKILGKRNQIKGRLVC